MEKKFIVTKSQLQRIVQKAAIPTHQAMVTDKNGVMLKDKEFPGSYSLKKGHEVYIYYDKGWHASNDKKSWLVIDRGDFKLL